MKNVLLDKSHTHAGIDHPPGITITIAAGTADYLEEHGIGRIVAASLIPVRKKNKIPKKRPIGGSKS